MIIHEPIVFQFHVIYDLSQLVVQSVCLGYGLVTLTDIVQVLLLLLISISILVVNLGVPVKCVYFPLGIFGG